MPALPCWLTTRPGPPGTGHTMQPVVRKLPAFAPSMQAATQVIRSRRVAPLGREAIMRPFTNAKLLVSAVYREFDVAWITIPFRLIEHDHGGSIGTACRDRPGHPGGAAVPSRTLSPSHNQVMRITGTGDICIPPGHTMVWLTRQRLAIAGNFP